MTKHASTPAQAYGRTRWIIAEGYIPRDSSGPQPEMLSHETACMLNTGEQDAHVHIYIYFADRDPIGPYRVTVPARRTLHMRFNDLEHPQRLPLGVDFSAVIESDVAIVVQHTRLDSRQPCHALLSTVAFPAD